MSFSDDEEEFGFYNTSLCARCDEAKPRKEFFKAYDYIDMSKTFHKTCKECRDKAKTAKEQNATSANNVNIKRG